MFCFVLFCFVLFCFVFQGKRIVKRSKNVIRLVGDAVLALRVPDEEMISIETTGLTLTLGRHSPDKLKGLQIEERGARFVLPAEKKALESSGIQGASFVDTQVWILYQAADDNGPERNKFVFLLNLTFLKHVVRDNSLDFISRNTEKLTVAPVTGNKEYN